ncbi:hypothetical protein DSO57_1009494 [Entomophthora muscae]|uniref:Uncharacterized protein n=1 Tax=Entomophthora muscae TaxID=34485 RepID=A0ACC2UGL4_9FUNG|nr:hypothetical protein DSO57_1009494 [Entomophthora muscae]
MNSPGRREVWGAPGPSLALPSCSHRSRSRFGPDQLCILEAMGFMPGYEQFVEGLAFAALGRAITLEGKAHRRISPKSITYEREHPNKVQGPAVGTTEFIKPVRVM